ncbi:hypothetical protein DPX16_12116 [Anabarilius grahami]|uniref:Uncharacterized protein n=1 Tax=Anabarilius grahami TaxID=495550 RepID=A0A3N0YR82_ANAGA|nr:hypothetical protein DPX16_12116 [Anabarilius grahami]
MTSKRLLEQPRAGDSTHEGGCAGQREPVIGKALHEGAVRNFGKEISPNGHYYTSARERHYIHKKFACGREEDEQSSGGVLKHGCPAHRLILNGIRLQDQTHMEALSLVRGPGEPGCRLPSPETAHPHTSSIIPVPHDSGQYLSKVVQGRNSGEPATVMHVGSEGWPVWSDPTDELL